MQTRHTTLHSQISNLNDRILSEEIPVDGIDPSILVAPFRTHLTIGVMALRSNEEIQAALRLLQSLELGADGGIEIPLNKMGVFPVGQSKTTARVLWIGPKEDERAEPTKLRQTCGTQNCFNI